MFAAPPRVVTVAVLGALFGAFTMKGLAPRVSSETDSSHRHVGFFPADDTGAVSDIFARFAKRMSASMKHFNDVIDGLHMPKYTMVTSDDTYNLRVELPPGVHPSSKDQVKVSIDGSTLVISGSGTASSESGTSSWSVNESIGGLPRDVNAEATSYTLQDGSVVVTMPKLLGDLVTVTSA